MCAKVEWVKWRQFIVRGAFVKNKGLGLKLAIGFGFLK